MVGSVVGAFVGLVVGVLVGEEDGLSVGDEVGRRVGLMVGEAVPQLFLGFFVFFPSLTSLRARTVICSERKSRISHKNSRKDVSPLDQGSYALLGKEEKDNVSERMRARG